METARPLLGGQAEAAGADPGDQDALQSAALEQSHLEGQSELSTALRMVVVVVVVLVVVVAVVVCMV